MHVIVPRIVDDAKSDRKRRTSSLLVYGTEHHNLGNDSTRSHWHDHRANDRICVFGLMVPDAESSLHVRLLNESLSIGEFLARSGALSLQRLQVEPQRDGYLGFVIGHEMPVMVDHISIERVVKAGIRAAYTSVEERPTSRGTGG